MSEPRRPPFSLGAVLLSALALAVAYLAGRLLLTVAGSVAAAAVAAYVARPLRRRLLAYVPGRRDACCAAATALVCALIVLPLAGASSLILREAVRAQESARAWLTSDGELRPPRPVAALLGWRAPLQIRRFVVDNIESVGPPAARVAAAVARNAGSLAAGVVVFTVMLFLFLRDGEALLAGLERLLPLRPGRTRAVYAKVGDAVEATVLGIFLVAAVQGLLSAAGFALFRVPFAPLLAALCAVLSPIPFIGPTLVWVPVAAKIALGGELARAAALAAWFAVVVGLSDNVVRPLFLKSRISLPLPLLVVGVVAGLKSFGPAGALLGPVVVAAAAALFEALAAEGG